MSSNTKISDSMSQDSEVMSTWQDNHRKKKRIHSTPMTSGWGPSLVGGGFFGGPVDDDEAQEMPGDAEDE